MLQERHFQAVFRNKALPKAWVTDEALTCRAMQEPVHRQFSTTLTCSPGSVHSDPLCSSCPCAPSGAGTSALGASLGCALLVCQPIHLDVLPTGARVQKGGFKAAVQPGVHIPESAITSFISYALPSPPQACSHQTWFPKHLVQVISPQTVWKPIRITNF